MHVSCNRWFVVGAVAALSLATIVGIDRFYRNGIKQENELKLRNATIAAEYDLESGLRARMIVADDLAAFLQTTLPVSDPAKFDHYATSVLQHTPQTRALEYADVAGIIRYVYPIEGNEAALNLDLMARPAAFYVTKAKRTHRTNISDPALLAQGSLSIVIRSPIFDSDQYLGTAQAVCDVSSLLGHISILLAPNFTATLQNIRGDFLWGASTFTGPTSRTPIEIGDTGWELIVGWRRAQPKPALLILCLIWIGGTALATNLLLWIGRTRRHILGLSKSIEQKSADLVISQERYRTLVETADDMILLFSMDGAMIFANAATRRRMGSDPCNEPELDDPTGTKCRDQSNIRAGLPEVIRKGKHSIEYSVPEPDGETSYRYGRMNLICDEDGRPESILVILRDITEQKRLEEKAARLQAEFHRAQKLEAVGRFVAGIAHDFNNIIMVINGNAELLRYRVSQDEELLSTVDAIVRAGTRAAELVSKLLLYSRRQITTPDVLSLNHEISQMREMLQRLLHENIEVRLNLDPGLWNIKADSSQIEQIVMNLAVNARDAMPDGGTLILETANTIVEHLYHDEYGELTPGEYVRLTVRDDGCGMTPEVMSHLFEPFYSTKGRDKGTGLGLATVYGIARQSGGHISVASEPGESTVFTILIPRVDEKITERSNQSEAISESKGTGTILIAEDDPDIRLLARQVLEARGYLVLAAGDGQRALQVAVEYSGTIDLLLTDLVMPKMGGGTLAEKMLALHPALKVVFMSGYSDEESSQHGALTNGSTLLPKPFTLAGLATIVRENLERR